MRDIEFRRALGLYATGVAVVTAATDGGDHIGITVNSFSSVSLEPPLILFSASKRLLSLDKLIQSDNWAVNVLGRDHVEHSRRFATAMGEKWNGIDVAYGIKGSPLLKEAIATFECEPYAQHDGGDHKIMVGRVLRFRGSERAQPLIFFGGEYRQIQPAAQ